MLKIVKQAHRILLFFHVFAVLGRVVVFLMYSQECHYCQLDLVVIEFTGRGPRTRTLISS